MKKFFKNLSLFKRYLTQFILVAYIPAIVACFGLLFSHDRLYDEVISANQASVKLIQQSLDPVIQDLGNVITRIDQESALTANGLRHDPLTALKSLEKILSQHSFLSDIIVKLRGEDYYYSAKGAFYSQDLKYQPFMIDLTKKDYSNEKFETTFDSISTFTYWPANAYNQFPSYLYVFSPLCTNFQGNNPSTSRVAALLIKQDHLKDLFQSSQTNMEENILLFNSQLELISQLSPLMSDDSVQQIKEQLQNAVLQTDVSFNLALDGIDNIFFVSYSNTTKLFYVRFLPEDVAFQTIYQLKTTTFFVLLSVLLLGVFLVYVSMKRSYVPIKALADWIRGNHPTAPESKDELSLFKHVFDEVIEENASLTQKISDSKQSLTNQFLSALIQGNFTEREAFLNACKNLDIDFDRKYYCVCSILIEKSDLPENETIDFEFISQTITQALPKYLQAQTKDLLFSQKLLLVLCSDVSNTEQYYSAMSDLMNQLLQRNHLSTTIGVGSLYDSYEQVGKSYLESMNALDYRMIYGKNCLITPNMYTIPVSGTDYPSQDLEALYFALLAFNTEASLEVIQRLFDYTKSNQCTLHSAKYICYDIFSLLKKTPVLANIGYVNTSFQGLDITNLTDFETVDDFFTALTAIIQKAVVSTDNTKAILRHNIGQELVNYINEHCFSYDFQITSMAEYFSVSPQHMRKLFKNHTGIGLSDYIANYKLEKAMQLLRETNMTLQDIVFEIGNTDVSGFIRLFKQKTGMTPGQYRKASTEIQTGQTADSLADFSTEED